MFAPVAIAAVRPETHEMCLVRLQLGGTPFAAAYTTPGQYVIARTRGSEGRFAFASAPSARDGVDILVKHGGTVADALCTAAPGAKVEISHPGGKGFPIAQANGHGVILCAAGSGVGPIRAVVQVLLARRADYGPIFLFHGQRGHGDFAFASEHAAWERGGIRVIKVHSRPEPGFVGFSGYVQDALRMVRPDTSDAVAFLCGMKDMIRDASAALVTLGLRRERIFLNY